MNSIKSILLNSWAYQIGLLLGLVLMLTNVLGWDLQYLPGDLGDTRFNIYILEHGHQTFFGPLNDYWNAPFMYPEPDVISFSDNLLGTLPIYSLFRFSGASIFLAFQLWMIALTILNYTSAYHFLKWLLRNKESAVLGAFIFAFSIALLSQINHAQTFPRFYVPLALWMILLFAENFKIKYFFLALLFLVLQFYNGIYLGFLLFVPFALLMIGSIYKNRSDILVRLKNKKWILSIIGSIAFNALLLYILMKPYIDRSAEQGPRSYSQIVETIPTIRSFLYADAHSYLWSFMDTAAHYQAYWDHQIFPGALSILGLIACSFLVFTNKFRSFLKELFGRHAMIITIAVFGTFLFFVRFGHWSMYYFVFQIPGFSAMRSLTRVINVELLFFGLIVGILFLLLLKKMNLRIRRLIFFLALAILALDNASHEVTAYRVLKADVESRHKNLVNKMEHIPEGAIVSYEPLEIVDPTFAYQLDAMLASQELRLKTVNGYSATAPYCYDKFWFLPNEENRLIWFAVENFDPDTVYVVN